MYESLIPTHFLFSVLCERKSVSLFTFVFSSALFYRIIVLFRQSRFYFSLRNKVCFPLGLHFSPLCRGEHRSPATSAPSPTYRFNSNLTHLRRGGFHIRPRHLPLSAIPTPDHGHPSLPALYPLDVGAHSVRPCPFSARVTFPEKGGGGLRCGRTLCAPTKQGFLISFPQNRLSFIKKSCPPILPVGGGVPDAPLLTTHLPLHPHPKPTSFHKNFLFPTALPHPKPTFIHPKTDFLSALFYETMSVI